MAKKKLLQSIREELADFKDDLGFSREDRADERAESPLDGLGEELSEAAASAGRGLGKLGRSLMGAASEAAERARKGLDELLDDEDDEDVGATR